MVMLLFYSNLTKNAMAGFDAI